MKRFLTLSARVAFVLLAVVGACQAESVVLLDACDDAPGAWNFWQPGVRTFSIRKDESDKTQGSASLQIDMKEGSGLVQRVIQIPAGADGVQFQAKASNGSRTGSFPFQIVEGGGETFAYPVKIGEAWTLIKIPFKDMKLWHYGNAPIENARLDLEKVVTLKIYSAGQGGAVFHIDAVELFSEGAAMRAVAVEPKAAALEVVVKDPDMEAGVPPRASFESLPRSCSDVTIDSTSFMRNGRPVFLFGGWQGDNECHPWLLRLLGMDLYVYNADNIYSMYGAKREGNRLLVERADCPWYEAWIYRAESNGLLFWHEQKAHARFDALQKQLPEVMDAGHFICYDPLNPLGRKLYDQMFGSWMRYTRKYPMFCYELFNETMYANKHESALADFSARMEAKYGSIAAANAAWGTRFSAFADARPPGLIAVKDPKAVDGGAEVELEKRQARLHPNLWADWLKCQEAQFGEVMTAMMPEMRRHDPRQGVLNTVQSHCSLQWDYVSSGVHPAQIAAAVDFYTHEAGLSVCPQLHRNDTHQILGMLSLPLSCDVVANLCPGKPVFNGESPIHVSDAVMSEEEMLKGDLADLHSTWKFFDATAAPEPDGWRGTGFDDSSWADIKVPEMWGRQGFPNCKTGLYRKKFALARGGGKLYLNGKDFCDLAEVYVNGTLVQTTKNWNDKFCVDVTELAKDGGVICARIQNAYFKDGMFYGGIRGYASLNDAPSRMRPVMRPSYVRAHAWLQAMHGMSGDMICYTSTGFESAIKIVPAVKKEMETVAPLLPAIREGGAKAAIVYPFETFRCFYHDSYQEYLRAPLTKVLLGHYAALLFSGLGVDVITNTDIVEGRAGKYRMIVASQNVRVPGACLEKLKEYVAGGGVLVADMDSFTVDDGTYEKLDPSTLVGAAAVPVAGGAGIDGAVLALKGDEPVLRRLDGMSACDLKLAPGAEACAVFAASGKPAAAHMASGKGHAYLIGASLPHQPLRRLYAKLASTHGIAPDSIAVKTNGSPSEFVEMRVVSKDGRHLLYAMNWGMKDSLSLRWPAAPDGVYTIRNLLSGRTVTAPDGKAAWSAEQLRAGIPATLENLDPLCLLLEREGAAPLPLRGISPTRREMLSRLWRPPEERKDAAAPRGKLVFVPEFDGLSGAPLPNSYYPTAEELLRQAGYELVEYAPGMSLEGYAAVLWASIGFPASDADVASIKAYVEKGGSLLLFGDGMANWHTGVKGAKKLWNAFGLDVASFKWLSTKTPSPGFDFMQVTCPVESSHQALFGVQSFVSAFAGAIEIKGKGVASLLVAPAGTSLEGLPLIVETACGGGKVLAISDHFWLKPLNFELGGNPQLLCSMVNYLAGKTGGVLADEVKAKALFITRETLAKAEREEAEGVLTFAPIPADPKDAPRRAGVKGAPGYKDPIMDMAD